MQPLSLSVSLNSCKEREREKERAKKKEKVSLVGSAKHITLEVAGQRGIKHWGVEANALRQLSRHGMAEPGSPTVVGLPPGTDGAKGREDVLRS